MDLNRDQKKAIEYEQGPLLIIAGAGTGKTHVISSKIIHLINSGKAKPEEILALTFTEKAANEMIERTDIGMPLGYEELCIKTFHSFSDQILRESGLEMGIDPGYKILSQVEQWFFFKKHLFEFDLDYYRPLGNPNQFIYALLSHFNKLKDELITPDSYIEYASKLNGEEGGKIQEIASVYKQYQDLLMRHNFVDFGDLCFYANDLLNKRKSCLKKYQNRFKYVLVDEFQDTNYAQFQLVLKLAKIHKNITVVGDDDQSIYKWRGASLSNILQFEKHFSDAEKVVLGENYRSSQNILDAAYSLIQNNNPDRLEVKIGINKRLKCHRKDIDPVEVHCFPDFVHESRFVAEKIKELHQKENVDFENFAILVRANNQTYPFIEELKILGIPYQVKNPKGLFGLSEIKDLIAVIRVLTDPKDDVSLLRILKMEIFDISMEEILELLNSPEHEHLFYAITESAAQKVYKILSGLIDLSKKQPVGLVINDFLQKSGLLHHLIAKDRFEEIENINEFAKQVSRFEKENEDNTVVDFVNYLNLLEEANAVFSIDAFSDRNSVQILTAHGAKGLEFDYVFIVNAVKQRFPTSKRYEPFEIPKELTNEIYPEGDFHLQEERRLFYVAMTRAKKQLFITYSDQYEGNKKWQKSPFVDEVLKNEQVKKFLHKEDKDAIRKLREFKEPPKSIFNLPPLKHKKMSYSQFEVFKLCPLKYNYRYLMKVPVPSSHAANFGSSIHDTLNELYQMLKRSEKVNIMKMKELYEKNWIPYGYESEAHENTRKEKGFKLLKDFFDANSKPWIIPEYLEKCFNLKIGKYWVSGRIDRIDMLEDGTYEVIDYKTGREPEKEDLSKNLQLSIYALACRDIFHLPVSHLSLYYLENNNKISTSRDDSILKNSIEEIEKLICEMENSDFMPKPGYLCQFCDYRMICPAI